MLSPAVDSPCVQIRSHWESIIDSMALLAEYRDKTTGGHIQRTKGYFRLIMERSGGFDLFPSEDLSLVCHSAALHDIGKVAVPDSILLKPGPLTEEEFEVIKLHPEVGAKILSQAEVLLEGKSFLSYAIDIAEYHHERWDGSGYPYGLAGEDIPFLARVMAIADVYDALVSERPYKPPFSHGKALDVIVEEAGGHFDPSLVEAFLSSSEDVLSIPSI